MGGVIPVNQAVVTGGVYAGRVGSRVRALEDGVPVLGTSAAVSEELLLQSLHKRVNAGAEAPPSLQSLPGLCSHASLRPRGGLCREGEGMGREALVEGKRKGEGMSDMASPGKKRKRKGGMKSPEGLGMELEEAEGGPHTPAVTVGLQVNHAGDGRGAGRETGAAEGQHLGEGGGRVAHTAEGSSDVRAGSIKASPAKKREGQHGKQKHRQQRPQQRHAQQLHSPHRDGATPQQRLSMSVGERAASDLLLLREAAAGAFVHGLEDEFVEVRLAGVRALCLLGLRCNALAQHSLQLLCASLNDEDEGVREEIVAGVACLLARWGSGPLGFFSPVGTSMQGGTFAVSPFLSTGCSATQKQTSLLDRVKGFLPRASLGQMKGLGALGPLLGSLSDSCPAVRRAVLKVVSALKPPAHPVDFPGGNGGAKHVGGGGKWGLSGGFATFSGALVVCASVEALAGCLHKWPEDCDATLLAAHAFGCSWSSHVAVVVREVVAEIMDVWSEVASRQGYSLLADSLPSALAHRASEWRSNASRSMAASKLTMMLVVLCSAVAWRPTLASLIEAGDLNFAWLFLTHQRLPSSLADWLRKSSYIASNFAKR